VENKKTPGVSGAFFLFLYGVNLIRIITLARALRSLKSQSRKGVILKNAVAKFFADTRFEA